MKLHRKIAIVMTYFNRERLLIKTLESIVESKHPGFRIIVVDDASMPPLPSSMLGMEFIRIKPSQKCWTCPVVPYNMGIARALEQDADIIILQNAECYHIGDVLMYANDNLADDTYISFACWNESRECVDVHAEIGRDDPFRTDGGSTGWYNHPRWNPRAFHFCNAYHAETLRELNGFDERFKDGAGTDDNDLVRRLGIAGICAHYTDETKPFVVHQWHSRGHLTEEMYQRNRLVYDTFGGNGIIKAQHILTEDF